MENNDFLELSISTLLLTFRDALSSLVPHAETLGIPWKDGDAYDDWDNISSALFKSMVARSIQYAKECPDNTPLAPYDILIPSYKGSAYFSVSNISNNKNAFVKFSTSENPFDTVMLACLEDAKFKKNEMIYIPAENCIFDLVLSNGEVIDNLNISV